MKKFYIAAGFLAIGFTSSAQTVLLSEDFQGSLTNIQVSYPSALTADTSWYNFDEDGLADASGGGRPNEWFPAYPWAVIDALTILGDSNIVYGSNSWTNDFATPVKNWLISPNVMVPAGGAILKFETAPRQTPRYLDGFTVRISTTTNDLGSFGASVLTGSQYDDQGGAYTMYDNDFGNWVYAPATGGWIHGYDGVSIQAAELEDSGDSTAWLGVLTQHTIDLSAYAGMNIFFAIVHETNDDNLQSVDNISVEAGTSIEAPSAITKITTYPNPTVDFVTVELTSEAASAAAIMNITDISGRLISTQSLGMLNVGVNKIQIDATGFASGTYNVDIKTDKGLGKISFIKK